MKKFLSKIMAVVMAAGLLPAISANAETSVPGYTYTLGEWWTAQSGSFSAENYIKGMPGEGRTGDALGFHWVGGQVGSTYLQYAQTISFIPAGNYRITYWAKGNAINLLASLHYIKGVGDVNVPMYGVKDQAIITGVTDGDWYECSFDFTLDGGRTNPTFRFTLQNNSDVLIDDLSLCAITTDETTGEVIKGTEYIRNGGFELTGNAAGGIDDNTIAMGEWWENYSGIPEGSTAYVALCDGMGYDDSSSAFVYGDYQWVSGESKFIEFKSQPFKVESGKKYNFSAYVNEVNSSVGNMRVTLNGGENDNIAPSAEVADSRGWKKITKTITTTSAGYKSLSLRFLSKPDMYIDNVFFASEDAPDVNLIGNGTFDEFKNTPVTAENTDVVVGWEVKNNNISADEFENTVFAEPTSAEAKTGTKSMLYAYPKSLASQTYLYSTTPIVAGAGEYALTLYTKGSYLPDGVQLVFRDEDGQFAGTEQIRLNSATGTNMTLTDTCYEDGWKKYQYKVNVQGERRGFSIICDTSENYVYVDDVSLTKDGVEYISNGSFENTKKINKTKIANLMAYPVNAGSAANISWINPKNDDISLKLYIKKSDSEEYTEVSGFNSADYATSQAYNEYLIENLDNWQTYKVKMELTIGETTEAFETSVIPLPSGTTMTIGDWNVQRADSEGYANITFEVDRNTGYGEGTSSIKVKSNRNGILANNFAHLYQKVNVDTSKPMEFKFMAKTENLASESSLYAILDHGQWENMYSDTYNDIVVAEVSEPDANGWSEYKYTIEPLDEGVTDVTFRIAVDDWADLIYIDNIQLYELDINEYTPVGTNLIEDGDFEYPDSIIGDISISYYSEEAGAWVSNINKMWGAGMYKASVAVSNISEALPLNVTLILAVYDSEGALVSVTPAEQYVVQNQWASTGVSTEATAQSGCRIKAMLWKGNDWSMIPLKSAVEIRDK